MRFLNKVSPTDLRVDSEEGILAKDVVVEEDLQSNDEVLLQGVKDGVVDHDAVQGNLLQLVSLVAHQTYHSNQFGFKSSFLI